MTNAVTNRLLLGGASSDNIVFHIHILSDGTQESNRVIFQNSNFWNNAALGRVMKVQWAGSDCIASLYWKQTTNSPVLSVNPINAGELEFDEYGGIYNPHETGATGDLLLSTAGLQSGNEITLIIELRK